MQTPPSCLVPLKKKSLLIVQVRVFYLVDGHTVSAVINKRQLHLHFCCLGVNSPHTGHWNELSSRRTCSGGVFCIKHWVAAVKSIWILIHSRANSRFMAHDIIPFDWLLVGSGAHLVAVYASEAEANPSDFGTANLLDLMRLLPSIHELPQPA